MHVSEIHLRLIVDDGQILVLHDDSKNVLAGFLILEYIPRENIAHHGQILNRFLVSLLMLKMCIRDSSITNAVPITFPPIIKAGIRNFFSHQHDSFIPL